MKLVWFGGGCFRLHYGGRIYLANPADAEGVAESELRAGVDRELPADGKGDLQSWKPRRKARLIDSGSDDPAILSFAGGGWTIEDGSEDPLLVLPATQLGQLAAKPGVLLVWGTDSALQVTSLLNRVQPGLVALADPELDDDGFASIAAAATESAVIILERRLAVEA